MVGLSAEATPTDAVTTDSLVWGNDIMVFSFKVTELLAGLHSRYSGS